MEKIDLDKIKMNKSAQELLEFGIINIDKPSGPTSFNVSNFVKKKLNLRKTSHFGTLDPKVTGVLPVALNRACKLTGYFLGENKKYVGIMRIHKDFELSKIREKIREKFTGKIKQIPPVKSRVRRQKREREIKSFELLEKNGKDILFIAEVEGGTYIRKLIDDLGNELGIGAHMLELRRIQAGIFSEENKDYPCVNLYDFEKAVEEFEKGNEEQLRRIIIPGEIITKLYSVVKIKKNNLKQILTGKPIHHDNLVEKQKLDKDLIVIVFCVDKFVGIYKVIDNEYIFAKSEFVMQDIKN